MAEESQQHHELVLELTLSLGGFPANSAIRRNHFNDFFNKSTNIIAVENEGLDVNGQIINERTGRESFDRVWFFEKQAAEEAREKDREKWRREEEEEAEHCGRNSNFSIVHNGDGGCDGEDGKSEVNESRGAGSSDTVVNGSCHSQQDIYSSKVLSAGNSRKISLTVQAEYEPSEQASRFSFAQGQCSSSSCQKECAQRNWKRVGCAIERTSMSTNNLYVTSTHEYSSQETHGCQDGKSVPNLAIRSSRRSKENVKREILKASMPPSGSSSSHENYLLSQMPYVSTTGNGLDGKTITGLLYQYAKTEVVIVCVCHGNVFSPAGFVEHAGGINVEHPLRHIKVVPFAFGFC